MGIGESQGSRLEPIQLGQNLTAVFRSFNPKLAKPRECDIRVLQHVWLRIEGLTQSAVIKSLMAYCVFYPCVYSGDFKCSDDVLNKVWEMCAYSLKLAMESYWPRIANNSPDDKPHCVTSCFDFRSIGSFSVGRRFANHDRRDNVRFW